MCVPRWRNFAFATLLLPAFVAGCKKNAAQQSPAEDYGVTDVAITDTVIQNDEKRLGINISGQTFYDSGQILKNLTFNNPGFEGESWQSILRCKTATATSCNDGNEYNQWPLNFLAGATIEVISGASVGSTATVTASLPPDMKAAETGVTLQFAPMAKPMSNGDFVVVKKMIPGKAESGWWASASNGGTIATEFTDLAPNSPGKQALRMNAGGKDQDASVSSYFDSLKGHTFVQMKGPYRLSFRAKLLTGNNQMRIDLRRQSEPHGETFLANYVTLSDKWKDYNVDFNANEIGNLTGSVALSFGVRAATVLLDDVSLYSTAPSHDNPTAFRDEVVSTLRELHPGVLRYNDGAHLASSIDNLIAPPFARVRAGYHEGNSEQTVVPIGLHEFLQLCKTVDAEPWFMMPPGMSSAEAQKLIEYLAGPATTPYGAKRAARGQAAPWTTVFRTIHLELGNEEWNGPTFPGSGMPDPVAYGQRAGAVFAAARSTPSYQADKFDLVIGSWATNPDWTTKELAASSGYDSAAVAAYFFSEFNDDISDEAVFGPMFAEPEMIDDRPSGYMVKQLQAARSASHPARLNVYELNIGTTAGSVSQAGFDRAIPSIGAGLALIDHMLLMMRDLGIKEQSIWELSGYNNNFQNSDDHKTESTPLFGVVVDMGGATNLRRPQYLVEELANRAIGPQMLGTKLSGAIPTWDQHLSENDSIQLDGAHELQTFAFADGKKRSLIVLNLSRTDPLPITFSGANAPSGNVHLSLLTSDKITDSNEKQNVVAIKESDINGFQPKTPYSAPPFSMTVLQWTVLK